MGNHDTKLNLETFDETCLETSAADAKIWFRTLCEAEYYSLSQSLWDAIPVMNLLKEINKKGF